MSEYKVPPLVQQEYVAYPRGYVPQAYGTSELLSQVYRGYHGMSYTVPFFVLAVGLMIGSSAMVATKESVAIAILVFGVGVLSYIVSFVFGVRSGVDIGYGLGWSNGTGAALGFLSLIVGVIMIAIMQYLAIGEMKRYGIHVGSFSGIKSKVVKAKIAELAALESSPQRVPQFAS